MRILKKKLFNVIKNAETQVSKLINYVCQILPGMMNSNLRMAFTIFHNWLEHPLYPEIACDNLLNMYRYSHHVLQTDSQHQIPYEYLNKMENLLSLLNELESEKIDELLCYCQI